MRRRRREAAYALAPFVPVDGAVEAQWEAWEAWEASFRAFEAGHPELSDELERTWDASLPLMPDEPFDESFI